MLTLKYQQFYLNDKFMNSFSSVFKRQSLWLSCGRTRFLKIDEVKLAKYLESLWKFTYFANCHGSEYLSGTICVRCEGTLKNTIIVMVEVSNNE